MIVNGVLLSVFAVFLIIGIITAIADRVFATIVCGAIAVACYSASALIAIDRQEAFAEECAKRGGTVEQFKCYNPESEIKW